MKICHLLSLATSLLFTCIANAQLPPGTNIDESKVPAYTLPNPLLTFDGKQITSSAQWNKIQRPYLYHLFEQNIYGRYPSAKSPIRFVIRETNNTALDGIATRKQVRIYLHPGDSTVFMDMLLYLPNNIHQPVPVIIGYNFSGNHTTQAEPAIYPPVGWISPRLAARPVDSVRGIDKGWPAKTVLSHGYGLATIYYGDIEADNKDGYKTGIRTKMQQVLNIKPEEWGAIGAWAWGLSKAMDYLQQDKQVDAKKIALVGHSRLGKASLWAGACDTRFSIVISNESGEGGAALSRRWYGETIKNLNDQFPYWFAPNYKNFNNNADSLPVDQHMLLALIAPRPLYVASAEEDKWCDPKGEFLSLCNAAPVYALFEKKGPESSTMPSIHQPVGKDIRYHIRAGSHSITAYDWEQYLKFADEQWNNPKH